MLELFNFYWFAIFKPNPGGKKSFYFSSRSKSCQDLFDGMEMVYVLQVRKWFTDEKKKGQVCRQIPNNTENSRVLVAKVNCDYNMVLKRLI